MRPVNLIPPEERRGDAAPSRAGALSWVLVGALAVVLVGVTAVVLLNKDVKDKEAEVARLQQQEQEVQARAQNLSSFTSFEQVEQTRTETVTNLAQSRFDWERVMRELARVIPARVWLVNMTGTVTPEVQLEKDANVSLRDSIPGPALQLVGCARGQAVVARLISAIGDIDGVTRVAAAKSEKPDDDVTLAGGSEDLREDCRTRNYVTQFELVAAFDAVPVPESGTTTPPAPETTPPDQGSGSDGGVGDAQQTNEQQQQDTAAADADAQQAANIIPGGGG